jgi:hypothetical protein
MEQLKTTLSDHLTVTVDQEFSKVQLNSLLGVSQVEIKVLSEVMALT